MQWSMLFLLFFSIRDYEKMFVKKENNKDMFRFYLYDEILNKTYHLFLFYIVNINKNCASISTYIIDVLLFYYEIKARDYWSMFMSKLRYLYKIIGYTRIDSSLRLYIQMQNMRKYYSEYISFFFLFKIFLCVISEINNMHFWFSFLIQSLSSLKQYTCKTSKDLSSSINFIYLYVYIRNLLSSTSV